ncbi:Mo-dependent nitrogenase C-terminal domain-containing protein [Synechocystis sp. LKSZ1]|uniref:Mo-dependent nitrogenase C-terminal domain-containing protein n=1 Tax=Synechocystis sp. LKSZ1 TaxID=3144951 RepID=UPI00336C2342
MSPSNGQRRQRWGEVWSPMRRWLGQWEIPNAVIAQAICHLIPAQCPFARTVNWRGQVVMVIPPLCKLNPLYDDLMILRFRALSYLADQACGEG